MNRENPLGDLLGETRCPACKAKLDAATDMNHPLIKPKAGQLGICAYCACLYKYCEDMKLTAITLQDIPREHWPQVERTIQTVKQIIKARGG